MLVFHCDLGGAFAPPFLIGVNLSPAASGHQNVGRIHCGQHDMLGHVQHRFTVEPVGRGHRELAQDRAAHRGRVQVADQHDRPHSLQRVALFRIMARQLYFCGGGPARIDAPARVCPEVFLIAGMDSLDLSADLTRRQLFGLHLCVPSLMEGFPEGCEWDNFPEKSCKTMQNSGVPLYLNLLFYQEKPTSPPDPRRTFEKGKDGSRWRQRLDAAPLAAIVGT